MKTELKQLKSALGKRNRKIAALEKVNFKNDDDKGEDSDEVGDNAGNAFGGKKSKKKWSKGKSRDKLQNMCLFDKPTYDRVLKEVPNYKVLLYSYYRNNSVLKSYMIN